MLLTAALTVWREGLGGTTMEGGGTTMEGNIALMVWRETDLSACLY